MAICRTGRISRDVLNIPSTITVPVDIRHHQYVTMIFLGLFTVFLYIFKLADAYPRFVYICTWVLASVFIFFGRTIRKKELLKRPDNGHARRQILVI